MQTIGLSEKLAKLLERPEDELAYNNGQLPGQAQSPGYQGYSQQEPFIQQPYGYGYGPESNQRQPPLSYYGQEEPRMSNGAPHNPNAANWATFTSFVDSE